LNRNIKTFDALLAHLHNASTNWLKVNKNKILIKFGCGLLLLFLIYIILLQKLNFDQVQLFWKKWYVLTIRVAQGVRDRKKVGNPCCKLTHKLLIVHWISVKFSHDGSGQCAFLH